MRARTLSILLPVILIVGAGVATAAPAHAATGDAAKVFSQTNAQRTKAGVKPLISDPALDKAAAEWARALARSCTFKHSTATWRAQRVAKAGWSATGENIAAGYSVSAVVGAWMASPGHKANILDKRYTGVGIGYAKGTCHSSYWVQIFGWTKTAAPAGAGDVSGDLNADVVAQTSDGGVLVYRGNGKGGWNGSVTASKGWAPDDKLVTLGDFTGDGINDLGRVGKDGVFELLKGTGAGKYASPAAIGTGWGGYRRVIGGLDVDGDRRPDVLAVNSSGALILHRGSGSGTFTGKARTVGKGWGSMTAILYAGDFNGDTRGDLIARKKDGTLWLYPTTGTGSFGTAKRIGTGWGSMTAVFSPGDFDGSGKPDVLARRSDGKLVLYRGNGKGGWGTVSVIGSGWTNFVGIG
jgi:hypothetical protein